MINAEYGDPWYYFSCDYPDCKEKFGEEDYYETDVEVLAKDAIESGWYVDIETEKCFCEKHNPSEAKP